MKSITLILILACANPAHAGAFLGEPRQVLSLETGPIKFLSFSSDGQKLIAGGSAAPATIYDLKTGAKVQLEGTAYHKFASFSPAGTEVYLGGGTNFVSWDAANGRTSRNDPINPGGFESVLAFSHDLSLSLTGLKDDAFLRHTQTGKLLQTLNGESHGQYGRVCGGAFSRDGTLVATTYHELIVRVWDARNGAWLKQLIGHRGRVCVAAFNPTGDRLVTVDDDNLVIVWDVVNGNALFKIPIADWSAERWLRAVAVSPDGNYFLVTQPKGAQGVSLWDMHTGQHLRDIGTHGKSTFAAAFSPDGALIAMGGNDDTTVIYRIVDSPDDLREFSERRMRPATLFPPNTGLDQAEKAFKFNWNGL